jgi:short-subunit dehydrogenase
MSSVAFITGASSGIGAGLARRYGARGWAVGLAARRVDRLEAVAAEIVAAGGRALVCPCDVAERDQVRRAVADTVAALGPVELLVANAGISELTPAQSLDGLQVERTLRVNFLGAVYAAEAVLPSMVERDSGRIAAIGSLTGYGGLPRTAAYAASKGALHNFFESLRLDLRGTGVSVTMITPGYVRTELSSRNRHRMPFMLELDDALDIMERAMDRRARLLTFPRPLSSLLWVGQILPPALYDWLASKVNRRKTQG